MLLSKSINDARLGYELGKEQISHLFYIGDLKIFSNDHKSMQMCATIVKKFSRDVGMEFRTAKCATIEMKKAKLQEEVILLCWMELRYNH